MLTRRTALAGLGSLSLLPRRGRAQAASGTAAGPIRIGILQDASGPYSYLGGAGSVACARQAAAEMAASTASGWSSCRPTTATRPTNTLRFTP